ncbi:MAG: cobalamin B12-binding domain-containing protein [Deltaproteobacteria bacterium]|nr:cobalamin B12-binding domain-containing protein [Deltaproteobacteria bacterium]
MAIGELMESAKRLAAVPEQASAHYETQQGAMSALVNGELRSRADLSRLIGGNPWEVMETNHAHHCAFMSTVFSLRRYDLLAATLPWVYRAYHGRGFSYDYFPVELDAWARAVERCLPADQLSEILAVYAWMKEHHREIIRLAEAAEPEAAASAPDAWAQVRQRYLRALLAGDPAEALVVAREIRLPEELEGFYLSVIQPAMYRVGTLWEAGTISVAEEHLASAITVRVVAGLAGLRKIGRPWRGLTVVSAVPHELHVLGAWMVSDLLEMDGWQVRYLGADTPLEDLLALVKSQRPSMLALSVTMPFNLPWARKIIAAVKAEQASTPVTVMVGGGAFDLLPDLWRAVGADAWAGNARDAVIGARCYSAPEPMR